jgi:hypothetical protein
MRIYLLCYKKIFINLFKKTFKKQPLKSKSAQLQSKLICVITSILSTFDEI